MLEALLRRRRAYQALFLDDTGELTPDAQVVMRDLVKFCRLGRSISVVSPITRQMDVHATFLAEGRREVVLRLLAMLKQDVSKLSTEEPEND